ncbi:hypothetical protein HFRIS_004943 [Herbaspirillum frisingense GSF30]|uniref:Uncharacterized protein n=2 Tax=Herbaspirillum frisingense TaxID=92645 RepID=A0AAI9IGI5_9BURK|nr:hypothetical protein HFRIS_004943 [Herbaspirillum frisingense GSF30]
MAAGASFLTFCACSPGEAIPWLEEAERKGREEGGRTLADLIPRGQCYMLGIDGKPVGAYLLEQVGCEVFILAAAGRADIDLTAAIDQVVTFQAEGFESVAFRTIRPGLMKKSAALGYVRCGNVMRKRIAP